MTKEREILKDYEGIAEEVVDFIEQENKNEMNHNRRYYRHNISLEYLTEKAVPVETFNKAKSIEDSNDFKELIDFIEDIENPSLLMALRSLPKKDFELIYMIFQLDIKACEIAKIMHQSKANVSKKYTRILKKIKQFIEEQN